MNNFGLLKISYFHLTNAIVITNITNNPCHLTCYYTDKAPRRHKTSRRDRGIDLPWSAYFCFVSWKSVEQNEAGDTLSHTFEIPDWSFCQTNWFVFRGTIDELLSPSVSPIFKHHHSGVLPALYEHYIVNDDIHHIISSTGWYAQTFTPLVAHTITKVKLKLFRVGNPGTITASIRATITNKPAGLDLCVATFDGNTLTTDRDGEWREIELPGGPHLPDFIKYAIVVRGLEVFPLNWLGWRSDHTSPTYTRGNLCISGDSGETWSQDLTADEMFEEWGIAI
ncbi:hypothetical protein ES708_29596 [subsurface metagenome]